MHSLTTVTHAEYKAIVGGPKVEGCTLYTTLYPCNVCAKVVIQAGITKVVYYNKGSGEAYKSSKKMLTICLEEKMTQDKIRSFVLIDNERKKEKKREEEEKQKAGEKTEVTVIESKHRSILLLK